MLWIGTLFWSGCGKQETNIATQEQKVVDETTTEVEENTGIQYSYDDFVIYRDMDCEETYNSHNESVPFNVYLIMCKQEESNFLMQIHVSESDENGNAF